MPSMPSPLSVLSQHPLGPVTSSGRFDAIPVSLPLPLPLSRELPAEDKLARVIGTALAIFLSCAGGVLTYLTLAL